MAHLKITRTFLLLASSLALTACMLGPNFHTPPKPQVTRYNETPLPQHTASIKAAGKSGKTQYFVQGKDIQAEWWRLFHSAELNAMVAQGIQNSPTLSQAYAVLRQASETLNTQIGNSLLPAFNATFSGEREKFSATAFGSSSGGFVGSTLFNLFNSGVNVSYTLDIFGAARRQIEALRAQVDYQQFELIGAYLTLTSNIVTTAITVSSLQEQIKATRDIIHAEENQLHILRQQFQLGGIAQPALLTQETLVEQERATLPALQKTLSQNLHALSVLLGTFPNGKLPIVKLQTIHLPKNLPVSIPSNLVRQRPDIRAAEALLHAASAQIGVATANLLPQLTITGSYGWENLVASTLFHPQNKVWDIIGQTTQPIFHGGALLSQQRYAVDAYDQACGVYRQTVLQAFQNTADSLRAIETDARALRANTKAELAALQNLNLTKQQFKLGGTTYLALLIAQEQYQQTVITRIQGQALRYTDTVALFQSLGGGWWNKPWCVTECLS